MISYSSPLCFCLSSFSPFLYQSEADRALDLTVRAHRSQILIPFGGPLSAGGDIGIADGGLVVSDDDDDDELHELMPSLNLSTRPNATSSNQSNADGQVGSSFPLTDEDENEDEDEDESNDTSDDSDDSDGPGSPDLVSCSTLVLFAPFIASL